MSLWNNSAFTLTGGGKADQLRGKRVSANYFSVLGIAPVLGRTFLPEEDQLGAPHVVLIGEALWESRFGGDANVNGATLTLDGQLYTVIGVIPSFRVLRNVDGSRDFFDDVYIPIGQWEEKFFRDRDTGLGTVAYGRLREGVTLAQARADTARVAKNLADAYPDDRGVGITIVPLKEDTVGEVEPILWMLFAAVGFVALIACTNIANLLLARSEVRAREFAVRAAVGATRGRIIRQSLSEGVLLSCAGGTLAMALAAWGTQSVLRFLPSALPGASLVGLNSRVLFFSLCLSILTGVLFALVPALKVSRTSLQETLKENGRAVIGGRHRAQAAFIVAEIALASVLLVGAGLMIRSLAHLWSVNPGFDRHNVEAFVIALPPTNTLNPAKTLETFREVHERIGSVPGVEAVSLYLGSFPFRDDSTTVCWPADRPLPVAISDRYPTFLFGVGPEFFNTMRIPLLRGRLFNPHDDESAPAVVLIDEDLAKAAFGSQDPVGKRVIFQRDNVAQIVGVVGHVKTGGLDDTGWIQIRSQLYLPYSQLPDEELVSAGRNVGAVIRSTIPPAALLPSIQNALNQLDSNYVIYGAQTMNNLIEGSLARQRFSMFLLNVFAGIALVLALIGIYGVISYLVTERTHEIGVCMALGAGPGDILKLVIGKALVLALLGIGIGIVAALALSRSLSSLLFGVRPTDPLTFAGVALLLFVVALLASYIPARRATKVDPMVALRYE